MRFDNKTGSTQPKQKAPLHLVVHDVHILDSSGSMQGGKYSNALEGINSDIKASKESAKTTPNLTSTMTIVEFSNTIHDKMVMEPIDKVGQFSSRNMGDMTALYQAIGQTIEMMLKRKGKDDKVLMKIFTDGMENASRGTYAPIGVNKACPALANLIQKVEKEDNFTVTFVGTDSDVKSIINNLHIDATNTLVHDNTSRGVKMSFEKTVGARAMYLASAERGEDVSTGFYSKVLN